MYHQYNSRNTRGITYDSHCDVDSVLGESLRLRVIRDLRSESSSRLLSFSASVARALHQTRRVYLHSTHANFLLTTPLHLHFNFVTQPAYRPQLQIIAYRLLLLLCTTCTFEQIGHSQRIVAGWHQKLIRYVVSNPRMVRSLPTGGSLPVSP